MGIQTSLLNYARYLYGVQIAGISNNSGFVTGGISTREDEPVGAPLRISAYGCQVAGLLNKAWLCHGIQVTGGVNAARSLSGVQVGAIVNVAGSLRGVQAGLINRATAEAEGFQLGVLNIANTRSDSSPSRLAVQVGLLNIMEHGFLPVFPIINFSVR